MANRRMRRLLPSVIGVLLALTVAAWSGGHAVAASPARKAGPAAPTTTASALSTLPDGVAALVVIGSDARSGENPQRTRADSVHLLVANTATGDAVVVGFPRDSYVAIPGRGRGKINSSLVYGGPALTVATIRQLTGIPVQHYVLTGFDGFTKLINAYGGVRLHVDRKMNDVFSGARFAVGVHRMNGDQALAYARNRKDTPRGDLSRAENHGKLMLAALAKVRSEAGSPDTRTRWAATLMKFVNTNLSTAQLTALANAAVALDPARVKNVVVPATVGRAGNASVVFLGVAAPALFSDLRSDGVLNGR